jgi:hypothetical protein
MKAIGLVSIACALIVLFFYLSCLRTAEAGLTIKGENPEYLTVLGNNSFLEHSFEIQNRSPFEVRLDEEVRTSCGCTVGSISSCRIPPGGESRVVLSIQLKPGTQYISVECRPETEGAFAPLVYELQIDAPLAWRVAPMRSEMRTNGASPIDIIFTISGPSPPAPANLQWDLQMPGFVISKVDIVEKGTEHLEVKAELSLDPQAERAMVTSGAIKIQDGETGESVVAEILVLINE